MRVINGGRYGAALFQLVTALCIISSVYGTKLAWKTSMALRKGSTVRKISQPRNSIDDAIVRGLEVLRKQMPNGIPDLGVPVLDPLTVFHHDLNIQSKVATILGTLDEVVIANLSTFRLEYISSDIDNFKEDFALSFERITISGQYNITGELIDSVHVFGNGSFTHIVDGLLVRGRVYLATQSGNEDIPAEIDKLQIRFSIKALQSNSENFMGGGEVGDVMNNVVSDSAPEFIRQHQEELSSLLGTTVKSLVNPILAQYTLKEVLEMIGAQQSSRN